MSFDDWASDRGWAPRWFLDFYGDALVFHRVDWRRSRTLCGLATARFVPDAKMQSGLRYDREIGTVMSRKHAVKIGRPCRRCEHSAEIRSANE